MRVDYVLLMICQENSICGPYLDLLFNTADAHIPALHKEVSSWHVAPCHHRVLPSIGHPCRGDQETVNVSLLLNLYPVGGSKLELNAWDSQGNWKSWNTARQSNGPVCQLKLLAIFHPLDSNVGFRNFTFKHGSFLLQNLNVLNVFPKFDMTSCKPEHKKISTWHLYWYISHMLFNLYICRGIWPIDTGLLPPQYNYECGPTQNL